VEPRGCAAAFHVGLTCARRLKVVPVEAEGGILTAEDLVAAGWLTPAPDGGFGFTREDQPG
jgi:hypothetical protein